ncbi:hypothetical protein [Roseateles sp.]|uniref:hypothetical protein n=1 Tax=Roseateles sp. TaxID=1971397 RepID=UPI0025DF3B2B|nr:hypothetical protein [Roseateles sp.]MBV8033826.1 hypothetical protein [Roseateles sp.]
MTAAALSVKAAPRHRSWLLGALLWIFALGPYAAGEGYGSSVGPHVLFILLLTGWALSVGFAPGRSWRMAAAACLLLSLHFLGSLFSTPCQDLGGKSMGSFVLFIGVVWGLAVLAQAVDLDDRHILSTLVALSAVVTLAVVVHHMVLLMSGRTTYERASGIFPEPSHLALALTPALVALGFSGRGGIAGLALAFIGLLLLLSSSSTLIVLLLLALGCVAFAMGHARRVKTLMTRLVLPVVAVLALVWMSPYRDDALARIAGVQEADVGSNASSIIYVMGWEHALENLNVTGGFGLGFNRMGCEPRPVTDTTDIIELMGLGDANYNDGSFTISKVLSELGWLGAAMWAVMLIVFVRFLRRLARGVRPGRRVTVALLVGMCAVLLLGSFIRGTGYFSGPFLAGLFALMCLQRVLADEAPLAAPPEAPC